MEILDGCMVGGERGGRVWTWAGGRRHISEETRSAEVRGERRGEERRGSEKPGIAINKVEKFKKC